MSNSAKDTRRSAPLFSEGALVEHCIGGNRGAVFAIDSAFMHSDEWYERWAMNNPGQDQYWYHVLVDNGVQTAYFPEDQLLAANSKNQINHPALGDYFKSFDGIQYASFQKTNPGSA